jgi:hypothetical protein
MTWDWRLYFPSEGSHAQDFFTLKIRRLWLGVNPRTWVPKASTLPVDHQSRLSVTELTWLVAQRPRFNPRPVCVGFVVDSLSLGQVFVSVVWFSHHLSHVSPTLCHFGSLIGSLNNTNKKADISGSETDCILHAYWSVWYSVFNMSAILDFSNLTSDNRGDKLVQSWCEICCICWN